MAQITRVQVYRTTTTLGNGRNEPHRERIEYWIPGIENDMELLIAYDPMTGRATSDVFHIGGVETVAMPSPGIQEPGPMPVFELSTPARRIRDFENMNAGSSGVNIDAQES